jgi:IclR family acetate operon transcriptional repressor
MAVKPSQSASRVLAVLENVAEYQPIGISELARLLDEDKSAVQRALATLAQEGWIRTTPGKPTRWELTPRIHEVAQAAQGSHDLRHRARPALQALRDATGETICLNVPSRDRFVVAEVVESRHYLRVVLAPGAIVPALASATGRAVLPYLSPDRQSAFLGGPPDATELAAFRQTIDRGYAVSRDLVVEGYTNIATAVFEPDGRPVGAVVMTGPNDRLPPADHERIGALVSAAAARLSRGDGAQPAEQRAVA